MTALQMQFAPPFLASITEDPMELTSDTDQRTGGANDIDIDLDLTGDNQQDAEDEFMGGEDTNALADSTSADEQKAHAGNDDEMAEDSYVQGLVDERSSVRDEDIEDAEYTGPELEEDNVVVPEIDYANEQSEELIASYGETIGDQNQEPDYHEQEHHQQEHHEQLTTPEVVSGVVEKDSPNRRSDLIISSPDVTKVATERMSEGHHLVTSKDATVSSGMADHTPEPPNGKALTTPDAKLEHVREETLPAPLDQDVVTRSNVEEALTRGEDAVDSPAHLHPILLDYQGDEMFLFPPVDQGGEHATFLLADEQLAHGNIEKLLKACRYVLKGSLSEQDELMITIHDLDIHISESTIECASTRLSEVVDLYVRLQQNDGLENPPPLYMDLTAKNRFSCRLNLLRNALDEGTGLSQLKSSEETENVEQHGFYGEVAPSNHTTGLSSDDAYSSEQRPGEDAEGTADQYFSLGHAPLSEKLIPETDSGTQGTQPYALKDVANGSYRAEALLGGDSSVHEAGASDDFPTQAGESTASFKAAQALAANSELQQAEEPIVDDGDYIDYEDVEELKGGTSSASSTLQGDTINVYTAKDHATPNEPTVVQNQEHEPPYGVQRGIVADDKTLQEEYVEEKDTSDISVSVEEQPDAAVIPFQYSDDNGQNFSGQFDKEGEASEDDQDANILQGAELQPNVIAANDRYEASARYEDDAGSYWQDTPHDHADQAGGNAFLSADTDNNGELEGYTSTYPLDSESSEPQRIIHDDDLGRVNQLETQNELEEPGGPLANDDNDDVPRLFEEVNTRPSLFFGQSANTQEDDDEITYEDEEYDIDSPHERVQANHSVATHPESLKRARNLHEDDNTSKENLQDSKRIRSG